jgi:hypothetical protein
LAAKALHDLFRDFWLRAMVQRAGKNSGRRSFSFSCPATSTAGAMRADVGELGSRADVIKIEWPPHGDGCGGRDREFADSRWRKPDSNFWSLSTLLPLALAK